ncbi:MAG: sigma-70 family RNA polymerase sigma factor [Ignavibacteria bacterium]|nr:sigma-70 family RNA polymerase sigma factor [Ignavibacteria bacterium]
MSNLLIENDNRIIEEYCNGDSELAATSFVRKYEKYVFSIALRYLNNFEDADEASQDVFLKALNNLHKFKKKSSIKTWLYRITVNHCNNVIRSKRFRFWSRTENNFTEYEKNIKSETPYQILENNCFEERFLLLLGTLPKKQREVFSLRYFDNLKYEEISKMLGTSVGGLKSNYYNATKKIATMLKKLKEKGEI